MNSVICAINLRCIPDSLGRGTIEAEIITEKSKVCASVPAQPSRLFVKEPSLAIADATLSVVPNLIGVSTLWQKQFDELLYEIDGTDNFSQIGANLAFALSLANAKAAASDLGLPLWKYLGGVFSECIPRPLGNVISNGVHIKNAAEIQGFLVVPVGAKTVAESIFANVKVYNAVKKMLDARQIYCLVGDNFSYTGIS